LFTEGCVFYLTTAYALLLTERGAKVLEFYNIPEILMDITLQILLLEAMQKFIAEVLMA
jgi:hypothetical protein